MQEINAWIPAFAGMTNNFPELVVPAEAGTQDGHVARRDGLSEGMGVLIDH